MAEKPKPQAMALYERPKTALERAGGFLGRLAGVFAEPEDPSAPRELKKEEPLTEKEYRAVADFRATGLPELVMGRDQMPKAFEAAMREISLRTAGAKEKSRENFDKLLADIAAGLRAESEADQEICENGSALSGWLASETERAMDGISLDQLLEEIPSEHEQYVAEVDQPDANDGKIRKKVKERGVSLETATYEFNALEGEQWKPKTGFEFRKDRTLRRIPKFLDKIRQNPEFLKKVTEMRKNDTEYLALVEKIKTLAKVYEILEETDVSAVSTEIAEIIARMRAAFLAIEFDYSGQEIKPVDSQTVEATISLHDEYQKKIAEEKENKKSHEARLLGEIKKLETKQGTMSEYLKLRISRYQKFWSQMALVDILRELKYLMSAAQDARADLEARRRAGKLDGLTEQMIWRDYETSKRRLLKALEAPFLKGDEDAPEAENFFMAEYEVVEKAFGEQFFGYDASVPLINQCRKMDRKTELDPAKDKLKAAKALNAFMSENPEALAVMKSIFEGNTAHRDWRLSMDSGDVSLANFAIESGGIGSLRQLSFDGRKGLGRSVRVADMGRLISSKYRLDQEGDKPAKCGLLSNAEVYRPTSGSRERQFSWRLSSVHPELEYTYVPSTTRNSSQLDAKVDENYDLARMIQDRVTQFLTLGEVSLNPYLVVKNECGLERNKDSTASDLYDIFLALRTGDRVSSHFGEGISIGIHKKRERHPDKAETVRVPVEKTAVIAG